MVSCIECPYHHELWDNSDEKPTGVFVCELKMKHNIWDIITPDELVLERDVCNPVSPAY
jgi:hypothetical protein